MTEQKRVPCKVCKEPILPGAIVCPQCKTRQVRSSSHLLAVVLKWAAGIASLIALLLSASELNKLVGVWLEKEQVVEEYADAAQLLANSGDHVNAQQLLEKAAELSPASPKVRDLRIELAQDKLRTLMLLDRDGIYLREFNAGKFVRGTKIFDFDGFYNADQQAEIEGLKTDELIKLFARGIVSADGHEKATLLAHLGWLDTLRNFGSVEFDIEKSLKSALAVDEKNSFANAMYAAWLLAPRNKAEVPVAERINLARKYFATALKSEQLSGWVKSLWLEVLGVRGEAESEHELLRVLTSFRDAGDSIAKSDHTWIALKRNFIDSAADGRPTWERDEKRLQQLFNAFPAESLDEKLKWLSGLQYGCTPGAGCEADNDKMANLLYVHGRILEKQEKLPAAVEAYRLAQITGRGGNGYLVNEVVRRYLAEVLQKRGIIAKKVLLCHFAREASIKNGDLLFEYAGKPFPSRSDMQLINKGLAEGQQVNIKVLRGEKLVSLQREWLWDADLTDTVVPEDLFQPGKEAELRNWLSHE